MLSDRLRGAKLLAAVALLALLGWTYAQRAVEMPHGYPACAAAPEASDGRRVVLSLWRVDQLEGPEHYAVSWVPRGVPVVGPTSGLHAGDVVTVVGRFRAADGAVLEDHHEVHALRPWKERLGLAGLVLGLGMVPFGFRVRARRLCERG
jgi:hypothetical protein